MAAGEIRLGCAGWSIRGEHAALFSAGGSHLERYARRFNAVEINSSFYRPHRPATYARWAAATPDGFQFAVKLPRMITHERRLDNVGEPLDRFLAEAGVLGPKLGTLLVQLPPSLRFDANRAGTFFAALREQHAGAIVCEPRHASWFAGESEQLLARFAVTRVAADPPLVRAAGRPGGWDGLAYYRLHGAPEMYTSAYGVPYLDTLAEQIRDLATTGRRVWCIFDNTAQGAATTDALALSERLATF